MSCPLNRAEIDLILRTVSAGSHGLADLKMIIASRRRITESRTLLAKTVCGPLPGAEGVERLR